MIQVELIVEIDKDDVTIEQVMSGIGSAVVGMMTPEEIQAGKLVVKKLVVTPSPVDVTEAANDAVGVPRPPTVEEPK